MRNPMNFVPSLWDSSAHPCESIQDFVLG